MTALRSIFLLLTLGLMQIFLPQVWSRFGRVDWLLIYVVLQSMRSSFQRSILLAAGAGLIQDSLSGGIVGLHAFTKTTVVAIIATFSNRLVFSGPIPEAMIVGLAVTLDGLIVVAWQLFLGLPSSLSAGDIFAGAAATSGVTMLVIYTGHKWQQRRLIKPRAVGGNSG